MRHCLLGILILAMAGVGLAQPADGQPNLAAGTALSDLLPAIKKWRIEQPVPDRKRPDVLYKFDKEYVTLAAQAAARGKEAAAAWATFDRTKPIAVLNRSPFGGGECAKGYWPPGVKPEVLAALLPVLVKAGLSPVVVDKIASDGTVATAPATPTTSAAGGAYVAPTGPVDMTDPATLIRLANQKNAPPVETPVTPAFTPVPTMTETATFKRWPAEGFSDEFEWALLVGLHHESIPFKGGRKNSDGKVIYSRHSRVNAWAILFYVPTATAVWGNVAMTKVPRNTTDDQVSAGAEQAIGYLDFTDVGTDKLPEFIGQLTARTEMEAIDVAALLAQSQRPDAVAALTKSITGAFAFKNKVEVLRYFTQAVGRNSGGVPQDFRIDAEAAGKSSLVLADQAVLMRVLLLEQLRGVRGLQGTSMTAALTDAEDIDIPQIGKQCLLQRGPMSEDDEVVLISEMAADSPWLGAFKTNLPAAVRALGQCKFRLNEAMAVAHYYATRNVQPPNPRGRPQPADPLRTAGQEAFNKLQETLAQQKKKEQERLRLNPPLPPIAP